MSNLLRDYMLPLDQLSITQVQEIRQRFVDMLGENWPQLDTRPNSVAGDLIVTPDAAMTAQVENAMVMLLSDLDLGNVASGVSYNPVFIQAFMQNFGITPLSPVASSGVVVLTFNANQNYVIDQNTQFTSGGNSFQITSPGNGPIVIYARDASNPTNSANQYVLTSVASGVYVVYLPVTGPAGASVSSGSPFTYTLTQPQLVSVTAAGDFDTGAPSETLQQMAVRAQATFAAANLNTRSGAISFLTQRWPSIVTQAVVVTGDPEMLRSGVTPLGIVAGAMDVLIKSVTQYAAGSVTVPLAYDVTEGVWIGAIPTPSPAAFYDFSAGIFQTSNLLNNQGKSTVYASSIHPSTDNTSVAFSKFERLGISIVDTAPQNVQSESVSQITESSGIGAVLSVSGVYVSYYFNSTTSRSVVVRLVSPTTYDGYPAILGTVTDVDTGESGNIYFVQNSVTNPTGGMILQAGLTYNSMLRGLNLNISTPRNTFVVNDFIGATFAFGFTARTANFVVNYLFDPLLVQVDSVLQDADNKPIGVDVVVRSLLPCYVSQFVVNYRIGFGGTFDAVTAQQNIAQYLSQIGNGATYEESQIGKIVLAAGATGLVSVTKAGVFFPSLASTYVDKSGNELPVPRFPSTTLLPPANNLGISANNVTYVINQGTIQFNATVS